MSSEGENGAPREESIKAKRRRMHGACDLCRQKKIRCDSSKRPGNKCTNCVAFGSECTHVHVNQKIGQGYRSSRNGLSTPSESLSLADLRKSMEPLLKTILSPTYQAPTNPAIIRETLVNLARYSRALESVVPSEALPEPSNVLPAPAQTVVTPKAASSPGGSPAASSPGKRDLNSPECGELNCLADNLRRSIVLSSSKERYFGASSSISLLDTAMALSGDSPPLHRANPPLGVEKHMRSAFWTVHPWETAPPPSDVPLEFPEPDLLQDLIELFFAYVNVYVPLLHRPTFERGIKENLHLTDTGFGATVLGVCAVASRYSNDERVLLEEGMSLHSCGYKWYRQLHLFNESSLRAPTLYELQTCCLALQYLQGSSTPEKCWFLVGFGIRAAQDIGLHLKRAQEGPPTIEDELRKRVWWTLVLCESTVSATGGRPPSINVHDYNVEMPIDCDDEYWETGDPATSFKQPAGKPTRVAYFRSQLKLNEMLSLAQQAFYSVKHPDVPIGMTEEEWDRSTLAGLDSALNAWVDSIPDHLRWDPHNTEGIFLDQSAMLFATFYYVQILVHRPFIVCPGHPALSFTSLAICTNAARACSRILEAQARKRFVPIPQVQLPLFESGLMLLLSIWKGRRTGFAMMDETKEVKAVKGVIKVLKMYETRWHMAGRFCDLLTSLTAVGNIGKCCLENDEDAPIDPPLPPAFAKGSKRSRETLDDESDQRRRDLDGSLSTSRRESPDAPIRPLPSTSAGFNLRNANANAEKLSVMYPPIPPPTNYTNVTFDEALPRETTFEFPMYSSDLSKPFFPLDPSENLDSNNPVLAQQLSELEAMLQQGSSAGMGGGPAQLGIGQLSNDAFQQMLFGAQSGSLHPMFAGGSRQPMGNGASHQSDATNFGTLGSNGQPSMRGVTAFRQAQVTAQSGGNLLMDMQDDALWSGVPAAGRDWNDWSTYISNVETLNSAQGLPLTGVATNQSDQRMIRNAMGQSALGSFNGMPLQNAQQAEMQTNEDMRFTW